MGLSPTPTGCEVTSAKMSVYSEGVSSHVLSVPCLKKKNRVVNLFVV